MGLEEFAASVIDTINPLAWFREGQSRDESRQVRADDINRDQANFERNSLSGRVKEGADLGLSKLASIGAQPNNSSTASVGQDTNYLNTSGSQNSLSQTDRLSARLNQEIMRKQATGLDLDNLIKQQELSSKKTGQPEAGAGFMPGSSQTIRGGISELPMERTTSYSGKPHMEPGSITGSGFETTPTGLAPVPSSDVKNRIEDSPYELRHFYRYGILPNLGDRSTKPPDAALPPGRNYWKWSLKSQEWQSTPFDTSEDFSYDGVFNRFKKYWNERSK